MSICISDVCNTIHVCMSDVCQYDVCNTIHVCMYE